MCIPILKGFCTVRAVTVSTCSIEEMIDIYACSHLHVQDHAPFVT